MYVGRTDEAVDNFLNGFHAACQVFGIEWSPTDPLYRQITTEQGWEWNASYGPSFEMRRNELPEDQVMVEMLQIEVEYWRRRLAQFKSNSEPV
jgi:hypothetical protein